MSDIITLSNGHDANISVRFGNFTKGIIFITRYEHLFSIFSHLVHAKYKKMH